MEQRPVKGEVGRGKEGDRLLRGRERRNSCTPPIISAGRILLEGRLGWDPNPVLQFQPGGTFSAPMRLLALWPGKSGPQCVVQSAAAGSLWAPLRRGNGQPLLQQSCKVHSKLPQKR